jgi:hypothetical protein
MRNASFFAALLASVLGSGCGPSTKVPLVPPSSPLHGGILIALPEDGGYVELLNGGRQRVGYQFTTTLVAYLLQPDMKTALAEKPASIAVTLDTPAGEKTIPLASKPETGDSVGSTRYVSDPGPYELNQRGGEVTVPLNGKTLKAPFRGPK